MITNLLASIVITLVTNTTERFPMHNEPCAGPPGESPFTLVAYFKGVPDANPTNKWVRTICKRITTVSFSLPTGKPMSVSDEETLWESEVELFLDTKWVPPVRGTLTPARGTFGDAGGGLTNMSQIGRDYFFAR